MRITGTFLDAVVADIPANNWGPKEWAADFDAMAAIGIDTVILIRTGWGDRACFDSPALSKHHRLMPAYQNQLAMFLDEAERCGMDFWFGGFDSVEWRRNDGHEEEVRTNIALAEEVVGKHGARTAFKGWYLVHEVPKFHEGAAHIYEHLAVRLKELRDQPILISPWINGLPRMEEYVTPAEHEATWDRMFQRIGKLVDICAFQDGLTRLLDLPDYLAANTRVLQRHGVRCWTNVETFERGAVPMKFWPIDWRNLRYKMEAAEAAGAEKLITFEFSHFMSPNSMYASARCLYDRYREWMEAAG